MATASEIIVSAYRESNLVGVDRALTTAQETEGLSLLNNLIPATIGNEIGEEFCDLNVGGEYDDVYIWEWLPENIRLVLNNASERTFKLHPRPYDGQRLAVTDPGSALSTANVTLDGNGRQIEDAATLVLNTDGLDAQWLYRADLGNWVRITDLVAADTMPTPREFDDYWSILLAMRLNPRHGREMVQSSASWLDSMANRLEARYRRPRDQQDWGSLGLLGQTDGYLNGSFSRWRGW
jgi:hypothetical protein